jgi:hypothetical protein
MREIIVAILCLAPRRQALAKQLAPRHWSCRSVK